MKNISCALNGRLKKKEVTAVKKTGFINDNSGNTMVEILVAFVLIMIMAAAFYGIIRLSSNMTMYSVDKSNDRKSYMEKYYQDYENSFTTETVTDRGGIKLKACDRNGNLLTGSRELMLTLNNARLVLIHAKSGQPLPDLNIYRLLYIK